MENSLITLKLQPQRKPHETLLKKPQSLLKAYTFQNNNWDEDVIVEAPGMAMLIAVALAYGVSDAGNNLALNSIIGRLFNERSEVGRFQRFYFSYCCQIIIQLEYVVEICILFVNFG